MRKNEAGHAVCFGILIWEASQALVGLGFETEAKTNY